MRSYVTWAVYSIFTRKGNLMATENSKPPRAYAVTAKPQVVVDLEYVRRTYLKRYGVRLENDQILSMGLRELAAKLGLRVESEGE